MLLHFHPNISYIRPASLYLENVFPTFSTSSIPGVVLHPCGCAHAPYLRHCRQSLCQLAPEIQILVRTAGYIEEMETIPLFPLNLVLFPGGHLPLRIFEPRYTDLVSECLRTDTGFGVCLIKDGSEVGGDAQCHEVGSYARIVDWSRLEDGLLGITAEAGRRFRVEHFSQRPNKLLLGDIVWLDEDDCEIGEKYQTLQLLLTRILEHYEITYEDQAQRVEDAAWLGYRLAELLPLEAHIKQAFLEMDDSLQRLTELQQVLNETNIAEFKD
jgi:uncharacterized protein